MAHEHDLKVAHGMLVAAGLKADYSEKTLHILGGTEKEEHVVKDGSTFSLYTGSTFSIIFDANAPKKHWRAGVTLPPSVTPPKKAGFTEGLFFTPVNAAAWLLLQITIT